LTHRTLLKVLLNPILRKFGYSIVSVFDNNWNFLKYELREYPKYCQKIICTSEDATRKSLVGEQDYNGKVGALDKCKSLQK
jgi:hypothetical protein